MPDVDLLLHIEHGVITHSIVMWIICAPILIWIGPRNDLPYLVFVVRHFLFGDLITANYKVLIPISYRDYGIDLGLISPISLSLEVLGFLAFEAFAYFTGDLMSLLSKDPNNLISLVSAVAMLASFTLALWMKESSYVMIGFEAIQALFLFPPPLLISGAIGMKPGIHHKVWDHSDRCSYALMSVLGFTAMYAIVR